MQELNVLTKRVGEELKKETLKGESTLDIIQKFVDGYIECVRLENNVDAWINEEGKLIELDHNILMVKNGKVLDVLVGNVMFASHNDEGDTVSLSESQIKYIKSLYQPKKYMDKNYNKIDALVF